MIYPPYGILDSDKKYVDSYGNQNFFDDLDRYSRMVGKPWEDVVNEEQPLNMEAFHKKILKLI